MSREIKFRAWASNKKHPGGHMYILHEDAPFLLNFNGDLLEVCSQEGTNHGIVWARIGNNDVHVMQFTGLKDQNGKEIYECDLVTCTGPEVREVVFDVGSFWVRARKGPGNYPLHFISWEAKIPITIIGNIHENPELLL